MAAGADCAAGDGQHAGGRPRDVLRTAPSSGTDDEVTAFQAAAGSCWLAGSSAGSAGGPSFGQQPAAYACDSGMSGPCALVAEWPSSDGERSGDTRHGASDADDSWTDGDSDSAGGWEWGGAAGEAGRMPARPRYAAEPARCATPSDGRAVIAPAAAAAPHTHTPRPQPSPPSPPTPPSAPRRVPPLSPPVLPDSSGLQYGAAESPHVGDGQPRPDRQRRRGTGWWAGGINSAGGNTAERNAVVGDTA